MLSELVVVVVIDRIIVVLFRVCRCVCVCRCVGSVLQFVRVWNRERLLRLPLPLVPYGCYGGYGSVVATRGIIVPVQLLWTGPLPVEDTRMSRCHAGHVRGRTCRSRRPSSAFLPQWYEIFFCQRTPVPNFCLFWYQQTLSLLPNALFRLYRILVQQAYLP
jgi:hypothetical protein